MKNVFFTLSLLCSFYGLQGVKVNVDKNVFDLKIFCQTSSLRNPSISLKHAFMACKLYTSFPFLFEKQREILICPPITLLIEALQNKKSHFRLNMKEEQIMNQLSVYKHLRTRRKN